MLKQSGSNSNQAFPTLSRRSFLKTSLLAAAGLAFSRCSPDLVGPASAGFTKRIGEDTFYKDTPMKIGPLNLNLVSIEMNTTINARVAKVVSLRGDGITIDATWYLPVLDPTVNVGQTEVYPPDSKKVEYMLICTKLSPENFTTPWAEIAMYSK